MRWQELVRESGLAARALLVSSSAIALVAALVCTAALLTVGRAAAADAQLQQRLTDAGTRSFALVDEQNSQLLTPTVIQAVAGLSTVEVAYGFSTAEDVVNDAFGSGGNRVAAREVSGDLAASLELVTGRWPREGEALVNAAAATQLGMDAPFGAVRRLSDQRDFAVVGEYRATSSLPGLTGVLIRADAGAPMKMMRAVSFHYQQSSQAMDQAIRIVGVHDPSLLRVDSPTSLTVLAESVSGDLAKYSASMLFGVLGGGAVIAVLVVYADALSRRSDLGRRMALGATRSVIVGYTVLRTVFPAVIGIVLGCVLGLAGSWWLGAIAPLDFTLGVAILTLVVMALSAVPGALWAAHQDPVAVLRIP